jgi:O-methyltransferase
MASRAASLGVEDPVYLCDTWEGVVKTTDVDTYYRDGKHDDTSREIVERLVVDMGLSHVELLQGIFPDDTADRIADDQRFRLCHCDVDVYQSALDVLEWVWPRLETGGMVVFDDYGFPACPGVTKLVDEQRMRADRLVLHNLNGHGIVVKR